MATCESLWLCVNWNTCKCFFFSLKKQQPLSGNLCYFLARKIHYFELYSPNQIWVDQWSHGEAASWGWDADGAWWKLNQQLKAPHPISCKKHNCQWKSQLKTDGKKAERLKKVPGTLLAWLSCSFLQTFVSLSVICVLHAFFSIKWTDFGVGIFSQFHTEVIHIILMLLLFFSSSEWGQRRESWSLFYSSFIFYFLPLLWFVVIELCDRILLCVLHVEEQVQMEREEKIHGSGTTTKLTRKKMFQTFLCW